MIRFAFHLVFFLGLSISAPGQDILTLSASFFDLGKAMSNDGFELESYQNSKIKPIPNNYKPSYEEINLAGGSNYRISIIIHDKYRFSNLDFCTVDYKNPSDIRLCLNSKDNRILSSEFKYDRTPNGNLVLTYQFDLTNYPNKTVIAKFLIRAETSDSNEYYFIVFKKTRY